MYRSESCSRDAGRSILLVMACGLDLVGQNVRLDDGRSYVGDIGPEEETRLEPIKNVHGGKLISMMDRLLLHFAAGSATTGFLREL